ncbi:hypothetical protein BZY49_17530 [Klebsiella pneumoniae]|nr:hypothetical protein BZY49_17530 [Klebsiella pneumoniae]
MAPEVPCPAALRLPGLGYRTLREDPVGRISVAPSGTKVGMAPGMSSPAALRLPGLGYMVRPSAPAVSATMVNKLTAGRTNRMPGKA